MKRIACVLLLGSCLVGCQGLGAGTEMGPVEFERIPSPIVINGDSVTAFRDPAAHYHDGVFRVFHTLVRHEADGHYYWYVAVIKSRDLVTWTQPRILTPADRTLNFSSPGNVVRFGGKWVMCVQSYPTPNDETYGDETARLWTMTSRDLEHWSEPRLLRVKGPEVPVDRMGRMIDPYLVRDKDDPTRWWCFYKQHGVSLSWSRDLEHWAYVGNQPCGENVCVLVDEGRDEYVMFHSPSNGIGVMRSRDLQHWRDAGHLRLGQDEWPWAQGRLTAGHVLDLRDEPRVGRYLMFFHGCPVAGMKRHRAHGEGSLGLAWSRDLEHWEWAGRRE